MAWIWHVRRQTTRLRPAGRFYRNHHRSTYRDPGRPPISGPEGTCMNADGCPEAYHELGVHRPPD